MRKIIGGALALTLLSSTFLVGQDANSSAKKANAKKQADASVSTQLQELKEQFDQKLQDIQRNMQKEIDRLSQQLKESNQKLQSVDQKVEGTVQQSKTGQRDAAALHEIAIKKSTEVTAAADSNTKALALLQREVKDLQNPAAIRFKGTTLTPYGWLGDDPLLREVGIGLFAERGHAKDADSLALGNLRPALDVAVAGGRVGRRDAEGDQGARMFLDHLLGDLGGAAKFLHRFDDVIGGGDHHDGVGIVQGDQGCSQADAGSRIAAARFADDAIAGQIRQMLRHLAAVLGRRDDPGAFGRHDGFHAIDRLLQKRTVADQVQGTAWVFSAGCAAKTASHRRRP